MNPQDIFFKMVKVTMALPDCVSASKRQYYWKSLKKGPDDFV